MILFEKNEFQMILDGKKTQTIRTGRKRWKIGSIHQAKLSFFDISPTRIKIIDVRSQKLGNITIEDSKKEGYSSLKEFKEAFKEINDFWDDDVKVWVIDFELVGNSY